MCINNNQFFNSIMKVIKIVSNKKELWYQQTDFSKSNQNVTGTSTHVNLSFKSIYFFANKEK